MPLTILGESRRDPMRRGVFGGQQRRLPENIAPAGRAFDVESGSSACRVSLFRAADFRFAHPVDPSNSREPPATPPVDPPRSIRAQTGTRPPHAAMRRPTPLYMNRIPEP